MVTGLVTVNGNRRADNGENAREDTAQPKGWDGNYYTTQANKTLSTLQQLERPRKNSRILRTDHHDPRPPRILAQTVLKCRCALSGPSKAFADDSYNKDHG